MSKIFNLQTILLVTKQTSVVIEHDTLNQMKMLYFMTVTFFLCSENFPLNNSGLKRIFDFQKKQKSIYF